MGDKFKAKGLGEVRALRNRSSRALKAGMIDEETYLLIKEKCDELEAVLILLPGEES